MGKINHKILILENCIQIVSNFESKPIFTIWRDEFEEYRKIFDRCEQYFKDAEAVRQKYKT